MQVAELCVLMNEDTHGLTMRNAVMAFPATDASPACMNSRPW